MNVPCPIREDCPGTDFPITNYSSEGGEPLGPPFISVDPNPPEKPKPGDAFWATGCIGECYSNVSQLEADLCAQTQQLLCDNLNPPPEPPVLPPGSYSPYYSAQKLCTTLCGNGSSFTYVLASGLFVAQTQAMADALANAFACQQAQTHRTCLGPLTSCLCVGTAYSSTIAASNALNGAVINWAVTVGSLPTGLTMNSGVVAGTPTTSGNYTFTVRATYANGNYSDRTYTLDVISLAQDLAPTYALPNGTLAANYDYQVTALGSNTPLTFTLVGGGFPLGVDISSSGKISGVVGEEGLFNPVIRVTDANGCYCEQALTMDCVADTCPMEVCGDEPDLMDLAAEIDSPKTDIFAAYSSEHCYVCIAAYDPNIDGLRFWKYLSDNTLTLIGQTAGGVAGTYVSIIYDPDSKTFLAPAGDKIWKINPVTDAVTSFGSGGWAITRADVRGQIFACTGTFIIPGVPPTTGSYISRIDGVAETVTQIGSVVKIPHRLVYSPESDCLYGDWDTGISEGMVKFNLSTNTDTNIVSTGCQNLCWDSDRNLLVSCGYTMSEWTTDTILDVQVYTHYFAAGGPAFQPVYISGLKKVFGGQYGSGSDYLIMEYDTTNQTTAVTISTPTTIDYDCLIELKDGSVLALINDYVSYAPGCRKLCLT